MSNEMIKMLSTDLPDDAIQRTTAAQTKKGYDTTGYAYQFCVDRLNDVCGDGWGFTWDILDKTEGEYNSGMPFIGITCRVGIWIENKENIRECVGEHRAITFGDALKGAVTNGFKKTAAFWGVGAKAFRGDIDDDNIPEPEHRSETKASTSTNYKKCPKCGKNLYQHKTDFTYFCWKNTEKKKDGCGANFQADGVTEITKEGAKSPMNKDVYFYINEMAKADTIEKLDAIAKEAKTIPWSAEDKKKLAVAYDEAKISIESINMFNGQPVPTDISQI